MPHPVKIYNDYPEKGGILIRYISRKQLEIRANKLLKVGDKRFTIKNRKDRLMRCSACGDQFKAWNKKQRRCGDCISSNTHHAKNYMENIIND